MLEEQGSSAEYTVGEIEIHVYIRATKHRAPGLHQLVFLVPDVANGDYETVLVVDGLISPAGTYLPIGK